jgi:hypothetical protein
VKEENMNRFCLFVAVVAVGGIVSRCSENPEPQLCKDTFGIGKPLAEILKGKFGLYVSKGSLISSTDDFKKKKLLLFGNTEGHMGDRIAALKMETTAHFLFRGTFTLDSIDDPEVNCPREKNVPCKEKTDTLVNGALDLLPRQVITYGRSSDIYKIFKRFEDSTDYVFVMLKSDSRCFSKSLRELIVQ